MNVLRVAGWTLCLVVAGCGGKLITGSESIGAGGDPGSTATTTGDAPPMPVMGYPGPAGAIAQPETPGTGGGAPIPGPPCGLVTCSPGWNCCDPKCGLCEPANFGCPAVACQPPVVEPPTAGIASEKSNYGFQWKDSWFITPCLVKYGVYDCINATVCPNQQSAVAEERGIISTETFPLGGELGAIYSVTFTFNAISEGKYYQGGTRDAGNNNPANIESAFLDTFHTGGSAIPSNYNVLRLRVLDAKKNEVGHYYLNSFPPSSGAESHRTFHLSYTKTIDVPGRGFVEHMIADSNCHAVDNCGDGDTSDTVCIAARPMPNEPNTPLPALYPEPVSGMLVPLGRLNSVSGATQPWHAQMGHLTVTKVIRK